MIKSIALKLHGAITQRAKRVKTTALICVCQLWVEQTSTLRNHFMTNLIF